MKYALYALLFIFQFSTICVAETGTNERPVNLPTLENFKLINDKNSDEVKVFQAQMPDNDVIAVYAPTNPSLGLPVTIVSKAKNFPIITEAEWLGSRPAIVEDYKRVAEQKSKRPLSSTVSNMTTAVAPDASFQEITPIKSILDRSEAITFVNLLKKKAKDGAIISQGANAVTMLFINGNLILLTTSRPYKNDADYDFLSKYNNSLIDKFLAVNPKATPALATVALKKTLPVASALVTNKPQEPSYRFSLHHLRPLLVFFPFIILICIFQYLINRGIISESYKISFISLMTSWEGTLTGFRTFLGSLSAICFYIALFFIPIVYLAMTSIEVFARHIALFNGVFIVILLGFVYTIITLLTRYIRGK